MSTQRLCTTLVLVALTFGLALAFPGWAETPPAPDGVRGFQPDRPAKPELRQYPRKWALVIGANFRGSAGAGNNSKLGVLKTAENDAQALYEKLIVDLGYEKETTKLLLGGATGEDQATKTNIWNYLKNELSAKAGKDDCVLFYFAGHGRRKNAEDLSGDIIPEGAKLDDKGEPLDGEVLELRYLKDALQDCPAQHKLLILDCCHSGQIFNFPFQPIQRPEAADEQGRRDRPCFWGAAACRSDQNAGDQSVWSPEHSPFTAALLRQLDVLGGYEGDVPFTADALFHKVGLALDNEGRLAQKPVTGRLTGDPGDYWFFPLELTTKRLPREPLLATLPGATGDWWFDKTPWLFPSVRAPILYHLEGRSTSLGVAAEENLKAAAAGYFSAQEVTTSAKPNEGDPAKTGNNAAPTPSLMELRLDHLGRLLALKQSKNRTEEMRKIREDLRRNKALLNAKDLHFLALLQQSLGAGEAATPLQQNPLPKEKQQDPLSAGPAGPAPAKEGEADPVQAAYNEAIDQYKKEGERSPGEFDPMFALCLSDRGYYELGQSRFDAAAQDYKDAWGRLQERVKDPPEHFQVYTLCKQAEAYRSMGNWDAANRRLEAALDHANHAEQNGALVAFATEHQAWSYITQWRVQEAEKCFKAAALIRADPQNSDLDSQIHWLWDRHGAAMAARFLGRPDDAVHEYGKIVEDIRTAIERFEETGDQHADHALGRQRLYDRLVNSMERLADCLTFEPEPDFAEAGRFLSKAIALCPRLPEDGAFQRRIQLMYKLAICRSQSCDDRDRAEAVRFLEEARGQLEEGIKAQVITEKQAEPLRFLENIAGPLVALAAQPTDADPEKTSSVGKAVLQLLKPTAPTPDKDSAAPKSPRDALVRFIAKTLSNRDKRNSLQRDDIEIMMFASRTLLGESRSRAECRGAVQVADTEEPCQLLLDLCRLVQENSSADTLTYLRPSFDLIFAARLADRRADVKELLDLAANATSGQDLDQVVDQPLTFFYFPLQGPGYVLLDVPHGASKAFALTDDLNSAKTDRRALRLPPELEKELHKLSEVRFVWKDPVHDLDDDDALLFQLGKDRLGKDRFPNLTVKYVDLTPHGGKPPDSTVATMPNAR